MKLTTFKKLEDCIMEECDAGTEDRKSVQDSHKEEGKSTIKDDSAIVTEKKNTAPTIKEKPVPLPRITK